VSKGAIVSVITFVESNETGVPPNSVPNV
jgi:hypothetical protein